MYVVCPYGEKRQDIRSAFLTAQLIASQSTSEISDARFGEMVEAMTNYLKCDQDNSDESEADLAALRLMRQGKQ